MSNYVDAVVARLARLLDDGGPEVLRLYALVVLLKGEDAVAEDVHDAWAVWRTTTRPDHPDLVPFDRLTSATQARDAPYVEGIRTVARLTRSQWEEQSR